MSGMLRNELPLDIRLMNLTSRALLWLFLLGALASAGDWLLHRPWWSIRSVRVQGTLHHVSVAALRSIALPQVQGNWFTVGLGRVQHAFEEVPWVRKAVVQRVWPLSLLVELQEQRPLALWLDAAGHPASLVNQDGESFDANLGEVQDLGLPRLYGPAGSQEQVTAVYRQVQQALAPLRWQLAEIGLGAQGDWRAQVAGGPRLELGEDGDAQAFAARLQRFVQLEPQVRRRYGRALASADLRYANGFAVKLQPPPARAAAQGRAIPTKSRGVR